MHLHPKQQLGGTRVAGIGERHRLDLAVRHWGFPRLLAVRHGGTPDDNALNPNAEGCEADDTDRVDSTFKSGASLAI